jgi:plasmid stabilization system protein ParE
VRIEWLPEAARNLTARFEWIAEQDPWAATDAGVLRILHGAQRRPPA